MIPNELRERLTKHGHPHLLGVYDRLDETNRAELLNDLQRVDLAELRGLFERRNEKDVLPPRERVQPLPSPSMDSTERQQYRKLGEEAFHRGEVAFLLVAGGQGTRLGFDHPKGVFPVGPVSGKPLFQIHVEKALALRRRFCSPLPFLVMTSPATDEPTRKYFADHRCFGLPADDVWFFCQGTMPALDIETGQLLVESPGRLCLSPNGHGGTITGLAESGLFDRLQNHGIRTISYFQVDNPLVNLADFVFLGRHRSANAEVSSKVLPKTGPKEKVGNFLLVDGRCAMIEYSDLPDAWAQETDDHGQLTFWAGNPAIHLFDVGFLRRMVEDARRMPWHIARKKVPHLHNPAPAQANALKFERFIFDILPHAERWTVLPTPREEEFAPVKNKDEDCVDCPATCRQMMNNLAARWLRDAGVEVPTDAAGNAAVNVEISPLFALDAEELRSKVKGTKRIDRDILFE